MSRPNSPVSTMDSNLMNSNLNNFNIDPSDIKTAAETGFNILKEEKNLRAIKPADGILALCEYDGSDNNKLTALFSLAIMLLIKSKNTLNEIESDTYDKLMTYVIQKYNEKLV